MKIAILGIVVGVSAALAGAGIVAASKPQPGSIEEQRQTAITKGEKVLLEWLECQRKGRDGFLLWSPESRGEYGTLPQLYAVRSWEIVDRGWLPGRTDFTVRIASSRRDGVPIEMLWTIVLEGGEITSVRETIAD